MQAESSALAIGINVDGLDAQYPLNPCEICSCAMLKKYSKGSGAVLLLFRDLVEGGLVGILQ